MTLIHVGNSEGTVGRCDEKCYGAAGPDCSCVCGGRNHGAGLEKAIDNTREHIQEILRENPAAWMDPELEQSLLHLP